MRSEHGYGASKMKKLLYLAIVTGLILWAFQPVVAQDILKGKKLIEWGWDEPDTQFIRQNIEKINRIEQNMVVNFEDRLVEYDFGDLDELALAYVLSIHKSQGSEFPCVVIPVHTQHYMMLQRNLLYTAVTRGKKLVILVGTKKALGMAVRRQDTARRYTALRGRLQDT